MWLVPGSIGVVGAANIAFQQKAKLIRHIHALEADAVIIDVGAGVSFNVLDLFDMADVRLVVMTPQLTALQNAYAFLKGAVFRELHRLADTEERSRLIDANPEASTATRRVPELVARVREIDAGFGARLLAGLAGFGACILGNQLSDASERSTLDAVARMMNDFLGIDAPVIGALRASRRIHDSVQARRPYLLDASGDESSGAFREIARYLLQRDVGALRRARESLDPRKVPSGETHDEPLPAPFTSYFRAHERFPVSCRGTLTFASGSLPVEILDVSTGGAKLGLEKPAPPIGSRALLILGCLPERPSVPCVIRNAPDRSAGVQFLAEPRISERIALEIVRGFATTTGATSPEHQGPAPLPGIRG